jgi:tetratricopeptide (TPR) repeat protein
MSTAGGKRSKAPQLKTKPAAEPVRRPWPLDPAICLGLMLLVFAVYAQVAQFNFVQYDDDLYVYKNEHVMAGLKAGNIQWALTAVVASNWMPVTLSSHMLDCQLFGLASGMHHLVNVLFHALSAALLFLLLLRATKSRWASAFVAFVFALHPLHVESVAWVAERKDVLSTFFWFLTLYAYVRYAETPSLRRYLLVLAPFCLGLMSKPMLVTLPFTLLLFDFWPLRRVQWPRIVWEKLPFLALAAGVAVVTYSVQHTSGAFIMVTPLTMRIENALNSYLTYILQTFLPQRLAAIYSFPNAISAGPPVVALVVLLAVSAIVIFVWRRRPYYAVGWFWYLGTLVPVIGLVQVGYQSHADRYTYIPLIGFTIMLAWAAVDAGRKWPSIKPVVGIAAGLFCMMCVALTSAQAAYWRDTETLFQHAIAVSPDNWVAHYNLGSYQMSAQERFADAIPHFQTVLRIRPDHTGARYNLAICLTKTGQEANGIPYYLDVLKAAPDSAEAHFNLGEALARIPGREAEAIPHFQFALRTRPNAETNNDLGACLLNTGRFAEAIPYFEEAVRLKPDSADSHLNLALALSKIPARSADVIPQYEAALRANPDSAAAHRSLGLLLARRGRTEEGVTHLKAAVRLNPDYQTEHDLGMMLLGMGKQSDAIPFLEAALKLQPNPELAGAIDRLRAAQK